MLVLARKKGESILIGDDVEIHVSEIYGGRSVKLAIDAPRHVTVLRAEMVEDGDDAQ